jgi:hypothetical protein
MISHEKHGVGFFSPLLLLRTHHRLERAGKVDGALGGTSCFFSFVKALGKGSGNLADRGSDPWYGSIARHTGDVAPVPQRLREERPIGSIMNAAHYIIPDSKTT